jgi:hypothetical protein
MLISTISTTITHEVDLGNGTYADSITITNTGEIISNGTDGIGIYVSPSITNAVIVNDGTIIGGAGGAGIYINGPNAAITNYGLIGGGYGLVINSSLADLDNQGTIIGVVGVGNGGGQTTISMLVTQTVDPGAGRYGSPLTITSSGTIMPAASGAIGLILNGATVDTAGFVSGGAGSTGDAVVFSGTGNELVLEPGASFAGAISGFTLGDTIVIESFALNSMLTTYVPGIGLELTDTAGNHITLDLTGNFTTGSFIVVDPPGDTTITAVCYLSGTRIATPGGECPIETLRPGDTVVTKFGGYRQIKWIGRQSYARQFIGNNREQIPVRICRNALAPNLPKRDLFVSPGHSMLIGDVLVLAKSLINGITICQDECPEQVDYFQLEFNSHDCIMAEGAWSESYADTPDWRNKFHNAAEFYALFPDHVSPPEQRLCAARPLAGFALARALRPVVLHAAIALPPGRLRGVIDRADANGSIEGWAQDVAYPHLPVQLEIWAGGRMAGHVLACDPREDLAAAGIGHGRCGFSFGLPAGWPAVDVQVRRSTDGTRLAPASAARTAA